MLSLIVGICIGSAASWAGVDLIRRWAEQHLLDIPNERSSHSRPVPRGGGAAIAGVVLAGWGMLLVLEPEVRSSLWPLAVGAILIAAVSWLDDLRTLSTHVRFAVHATAVLLPLLILGYWDIFAWPLLATYSVAWGGGLLVLLWGVGLTNAYNFMDGIDGIAAVQAIAAGTGWLIAGWWLEAPVVAWTGALLGAGAIGFLPHNWPPARIFMGDVGSAFIGYVLAMIALVAYTQAPTEDAIRYRIPFAALAFVWPFVFDAVFTMLRRLRKGENIFAAHRSHLYQRMVIAGAAHAHVSLVYLACATISTIAGLLWLKESPYSGGILVATFVVEGVFLLVAAIRKEQAFTRHAG